MVSCEQRRKGLSYSRSFIPAAVRVRTTCKLMSRLRARFAWTRLRLLLPLKCEQLCVPVDLAVVS